MVNRQRGEVAIDLDGKPHTLCLTLGAMAELEDTLALDNIGALASRFSDGKVSAQDLIPILGAALRGGGHDISDEAAATMRCEGGLSGLARHLIALLKVTFNPVNMPSNEEGDAMRSDAPGHGEGQAPNPA